MVDWDPLLRKYWAVQIFDILFPVKDPIITTQLYQATLKTANAQVRKTLVAWRAKMFKAGHKRARKEFGHNVTPSPSSTPQAIAKLPSTAARTDATVQENRSGTEVTKEQAMKSLRIWRCRTCKSDFRTQNNIFNVEEVMPNRVINHLAEQRAKIKAVSMIPSMVQWEPQQQRYLQEVFDILS
ncbi:hypothetical protein BGZ82_002069 [Podila clonocystis]|nr:hypothetical protein BGZ82_002069 [Podila clonocystis]